MAVRLTSGVFCVSVDSADARAVTEGAVADRRAQTAQLLDEFKVPSNWTILDPNEPLDLPAGGEVTARIPASMKSRGELVRLLRRFHAGLAGRSQALTTIAADPYQTRLHWDVLVRQGCVAARPRSSEPTDEVEPQLVRCGLWNIPISCTFAGGSRSTIRARFGICRQRLIESANCRRVFHLSIQVSNPRTSWQEEREALEALLRAAAQQRRLGTLQFATLGELPGLLAGQRQGKPLRSILLPAA